MKGPTPDPTYPGPVSIDPAHDTDGNMTDGPVPGANGLLPGVAVPTDAEPIWDAENRLVEIDLRTSSVSYEYDYLGRRMSRGEGATMTHYLYDGWNCIAEYTGTSSYSHQRSYVWGLDLSQSPQGAGGVGGLLSIVESGGATRYYPAYDGNGNVSEYVNQSGAEVAHFEYDPFGNLTVDASSNADSFPYRFSTKPQDTVTGLYYYGYRYYDPVTGRWPSRDPIEERGGVNLYGLVGNNGVNWIDILGLHKPGSPFDSVEAAIIAGGEYAVGLSEPDLERRIREWEKKAQEVAKTPTRLDNNDAGFKPKNFNEFCGKICCFASGENKGKFYYQTATPGNPANPGADGGSCTPSFAPSCNGEDKPVAAYHNHPPNSPRANLSPDDKKKARDGVAPFGERVSDRGKDGLPKNSPIGATQRDPDGGFSTQIYDPNAPPESRIQNHDHGQR